MRGPASLAVLIALVGCGPRPDAPSSPRQTAEDFRAFYFRDYGRGMPSRVELDKLAPLLTPEFQKRFEAALRAHECHLAKVGNREPPLVQGDIFTSLFEGATSGGVGAVKTSGSSAIAEMYWTYGVSQANAKPVNWTDGLIMQREQGRWRIADIEHHGTWDFAQKGRLSEQLDAVANACH